MTKPTMTKQKTLFGDVSPPPAKKKAEVVKVATPKAKAKAKKPTGTAVAVHKPAQPRSLLEVCILAAQNPNMDPAKVREFLSMARDEEMRHAEREFDEAMLEAQKEMPKVPRDAYNKHTKAWWARIEQVAAMCDPIIRKHGFTLSYGMSDSPLPEHYRVFADVTHRANKMSFTKRYSADYGMDVKGPKGEGTKSAAQGSTSVITTARRNIKLMIFDVHVLGIDRDGAPADRPAIDKDQLKELREKMKAANVDDEAFCGVFKIDKVEYLSVDQLPAALARIERKAAHA